MLVDLEQTQRLRGRTLFTGLVNTWDELVLDNTAIRLPIFAVFQRAPISNKDNSGPQRHHVPLEIA
jgi:hypothetical protein